MLGPISGVTALEVEVGTVSEDDGSLVDEVGTVVEDVGSLKEALGTVLEDVDSLEVALLKLHIKLVHLME